MKNSLPCERRKYLPTVPQEILDATIDGSWGLSQQNENFLINPNTDMGVAIFATKSFRNFIENGYNYLRWHI